MAPLYNGRHSHACAIVNDGEFIVVAGGVTIESEEIGGSTIAEMFELSTLTWHKMPALPKGLIDFTPIISEKWKCITK